ncbi:UNVERIFIED_CONTAM: hypothetical protein PYX00_002431 [Menopon gallinae]|uniref:Secreted protein n=1 Tax=Menopon gallinae TaxID=328185 RepID=A0AAW2IIB2_9NEOP
MLHRSYIGALSILLLLHSEEGDAKETEGLRREPALLRPSDVPGDRERPAGTTLNAEPFPWVRRIQGSTSAVREFASRVTEILDRISKNWVSTGAKTVQNEEVRLRKLNGEVKEKLGELIRNGSKYGQRIIDCLNRTIFVAGLEKIVEDTTECYSRPLATVQEQLMRIEKEADDVLDRMESYGKRMFEMLSACFSEDSTPAVIECLQKVEGTNTGKYSAHPETFPANAMPEEENPPGKLFRGFGPLILHSNVLYIT